MVTISKKIEYAIILVSYLAENEGKFVSLTDVSKELYLPYRFLAQLAVELKKNGLLEAREGRGGGYELKKNWQKVNLYQLIKMLGEDKSLVECLCTDGCNCEREPGCKMKKLWIRLEKVFRDELKTIKLGEIDF